tara:strand:+ start:2096 stop:2563 length:468 start_codon:yes stop_codon:yes gene_type:complete
MLLKNQNTPMAVAKEIVDNFEKFNSLEVDVLFTGEVITDLTAIKDYLHHATVRTAGGKVTYFTSLVCAFYEKGMGIQICSHAPGFRIDLELESAMKALPVSSFKGYLNANVALLCSDGSKSLEGHDIEFDIPVDPLSNYYSNAQHGVLIKNRLPM